MIQKEEKFTDYDRKLLEAHYQETIFLLWVGILSVPFLLFIFAYIPNRHRDIPVSIQDWKEYLMTYGIWMISIVLYAFFSKKKEINKDRKKGKKIHYEYEVVKKERSFLNKTFYLFLGEKRSKETVSEELYDNIQLGEFVSFSNAKYCQLRLDQIHKKP